MATPADSQRAIPPVLKIVGLVVFASTLFTRAVDPVIPQIAVDLVIDAKTAALLSTAYTFPYALVQPLLGALSDTVGKTRVMNVALLIVAVTALISSMVTDFSVLVGMRITMALVGDLVPVGQRQVAIGRLLAIGLTGNLLGASIAGVIGDLFGWRGIFLVLGLFGLVVAVAAFFAFRNVAVPKPSAFRLATTMEGFRSVFADPRAKVCFSAVFIEAVFIQGLYVAILLIAAGETRASIAGIVIAAFGLGGVVYSLSVPVLVAKIEQRLLMILGGSMAAVALAFIAFNFPWHIQTIVFALFGFGFYLLHGTIQVHVTELSPTARGVAASLHSCFFYLGQASGPVVYGYGFAHAGETPTLLVGAAMVLLVGFACARLLRHRHTTGII
jgi:predicted MFS family arabinose efflux permease